MARTNTHLGCQILDCIILNVPTTHRSNQALSYFHFPVPSTILMYRSMGTSVKRSVPPGFGHFTSNQSNLVCVPTPRTKRGSWDDKKLPPPTLVRLRFKSPA